MEKLIACIIIIAALIFIDYIVFLLYSTLFTITGLSKEKARTQTLALLTACGYSTKESELIINYRLRRKIANACIVTGYVLSILITSIVLGVIVSLDFSGSKGDQYMIRILVTFAISLAVLVVLVLLTKIKQLRKLFYNMLKKMLFGKDIDKRNFIVFGDNSYENFYATVYLHTIPKILDGKELKNINFHAAGVTVLTVVLPDGSGTDKVDDVVLQPGVKLDVFGNPKVIKQIFERN